MTLVFLRSFFFLWFLNFAFPKCSCVYIYLSLIVVFFLSFSVLVDFCFAVHVERKKGSDEFDHSSPSFLVFVLGFLLLWHIVFLSFHFYTFLYISQLSHERCCVVFWFSHVQNHIRNANHFFFRLKLSLPLWRNA